MRLPAIVDRAVPYAANVLIRGVRASMRLRFQGRETIEEMERSGRRFIIAFWHSRLFLMRYAYSGSNVTVLISRHRDGELIARTMELFGLHATRGSTTEGGAAALREIVRRVREGYHIAFTPDGPRGPRCVVQPGIVLAARLTRLPIVPIGFGASKKKF